MRATRVQWWCDQLGQFKLIDVTSQRIRDHLNDYLAGDAQRYAGIDENMRVWFLCPIVSCGRRVAVLYGAGRYFACRHFYDLVYESQREAAFQRTSRRHDKVIKRLGGDIDDAHYPEKPKGMHWCTYHRLIEEAEFFSAQSELGFLSLLERFGFSPVDESL